MKKIDLSLFPTETLEILRKEISKELLHRKKSKRRERRKKFSDFFKNNKCPDISKALKEGLKLNSAYLLSIPDIQNHEPYNFTLYLSSLLDQDWSKLYPRDTDIGDHYVYAHVDPRLKAFITNPEGGGNYGGRPFYIGKGICNRAFDLKRNEGHGKIIKEILNEGYDSSDIVKILFIDLSEQKSLEIEAKLIYYFGIRYSENRKGWLINLTEPTIPKFVGEMNKISARMVFREKKLLPITNTLT